MNETTIILLISARGPKSLSLTIKGYYRQVNNFNSTIKAPMPQGQPKAITYIMAVTNLTRAQAVVPSYCGLVIVIIILTGGKVSIAEPESNKTARQVYNIFCDPQNSTGLPPISNCENKTLKEIASEVK